MRVLILFALLAGTVLCFTAASAEPLETVVTYVSASAVYIDAGRGQGIQKGDPGEIRRGDSLLVRVEVEFVADHSASCRLLETSGNVRIGDRAVIQITPPAVPQIDSAYVQPVPTAPSLEPVRPPRKSRANRISGRVSVQALAQDGTGGSNRDFVHQGSVVRGQIENLFGTGYLVSLNLRGHEAERVQGGGQEWRRRLYELAVYYRNPEVRFNYGAGRILSNRLSGIGYIDGGVFELRMNPVFSVGAFGGTQPNPVTFAFNRHQTKAGLFAAYERGSFATSRVTGTLALAGNYVDSNINREFAYEQFAWSIPKVFLYQSAEMNINRGWRRDAEGSSLDLSNILLNARYAPLSWLTTTLNYDNRTNFRTYETRFTPDSLFDDALRQGWRLGMNTRFAHGWYALAEAGLRTRQNEGTETRTLTAGAGSYDLLGSGLQFGTRFTSFNGRFSDGYQPSLTLSRDFFQRLHAGLEAGSNHYTVGPSSAAVDSRWLRFNADWTVSRHTYGSAYGELYRGGSLDANRGFLEIGYRF